MALSTVADLDNENCQLANLKQRTTSDVQQLEVVLNKDGTTGQAKMQGRQKKEEHRRKMTLFSRNNCSNIILHLNAFVFDIITRFLW